MLLALIEKLLVSDFPALWFYSHFVLWITVLFFISYLIEKKELNSRK